MFSAGDAYERFIGWWSRTVARSSLTSAVAYRTWAGRSLAMCCLPGRRKLVVPEREQVPD